MRITGGADRGRSLRAPRGLRVRPTADKVRGAIFNILAARTEIAGQRWLDLFAGSGALGVEALSRGAEQVTFVDSSAESCRCASQNLHRAGFEGRARVRRLSLPRGIRRLAREATRYEGAFVDPPYRRGLAAAALGELGKCALLIPGAWVVAEHAVEDELDAHYGGLVLADSRHYGSTAISLYVMEGP
jgi:16S rRNA (guanine(966)-N(2))-methyltransferase RsmD